MVYLTNAKVILQSNIKSNKNEKLPRPTIKIYTITFWTALPNLIPTFCEILPLPFLAFIATSSEQNSNNVHHYFGPSWSAHYRFSHWVYVAAVNYVLVWRSPLKNTTAVQWLFLDEISLELHNELNRPVSVCGYNTVPPRFIDLSEMCSKVSKSTFFCGLTTKAQIRTIMLCDYVFLLTCTLVVRWISTIVYRRPDDAW